MNSKSLIYSLLSLQSGSKLPLKENAQSLPRRILSHLGPLSMVGPVYLLLPPDLSLKNNTQPLRKSRFHILSDFWKSLGKCELNVSPHMSSHGQREVKSVTLLFLLVPSLCALWEKTTISGTWIGMELLLLIQAARGSSRFAELGEL